MHLRRFCNRGKAQGLLGQLGGASSPTTQLSKLHGVSGVVGIQPMSEPPFGAGVWYARTGQPGLVSINEVVSGLVGIQPLSEPPFGVGVWYVGLGQPGLFSRQGTEVNFEFFHINLVGQPSLAHIVGTGRDDHGGIFVPYQESGRRVHAP